MDLGGKVALVTGGGVRVGRAICLALAEAGASVAVHYGHSAGEAERTVAQIAGAGRQAAAITADLADAAAGARAAVEGTIERFGQLDVLVNSAAIFEPGTLASTDEDQWDRHFAINLKAPFFLCREFARRHVAGTQGLIVNIADWRGTRPAPGNIAYTLTKSALIALTSILAQELGPEIRVNAVAPGAILPPMGAGPEHMRRIAQGIPLRRSGGTDDVANAVLYAAHSDFVTGDVLFVTGGEHLP